MGLKGALVFITVATLAAGKDVSIGKSETGKKIYDSFEEASPAIWKQIKNITVNATGDDVISAIVVTDLREDKGGEVLILSGGLGFKDVTLELKSPTILRGYHYHVEVYSAPASQVSKETPEGSTAATAHADNETLTINLDSKTTLPDNVKIPLDSTSKTTDRTARDTIKVSTPQNVTPVKSGQVSTTPNSLIAKDKEIKANPHSPAIDALQPALQRQDSYPPIAKAGVNESNTNVLKFNIPSQEFDPTLATTVNIKTDEVLKTEDKDVKNKASMSSEGEEVNHTLQSRGTEQVNKNISEQNTEENRTTTSTPDLSNKQSKDFKADDKNASSENVPKSLEISTQKLSKRDTKDAAEKPNPSTLIPTLNTHVADKNQSNVAVPKVGEVDNKSGNNNFSTKDLPLELKDVKRDNDTDDDDNNSSKEVAKPESALKQGPKEGHPLKIRDTKQVQEEKKTTVTDTSLPNTKINTSSIENKNKPNESKLNKKEEKVLINDSVKPDEVKTILPIETKTEKNHKIKARETQYVNINATQDFDARNTEADVIVPEQVQDQEENGEIPAESNQNVPLPYRFTHNEETTGVPATEQKEVTLGKDVDIDDKFAHDSARTTRKPSEVETADATTVVSQ